MRQRDWLSPAGEVQSRKSRIGRLMAVSLGVSLDKSRLPERSGARYSCSSTSDGTGGGWGTSSATVPTRRGGTAHEGGGRSSRRNHSSGEGSARPGAAE